MPEVAQATITVTPVLKGAQQKLTEELAGAAASAVNAASQTIESGLSDAASFAAGSISSELNATFEGLDTVARNTSDTVADVGEEIGNAGEKTSESVKGVGEELDKAGGKASIFGDILKANLASDVVIGGAKKIGAALVDVAKSAVAGYAEYEQLTGGVETLFKGSAGTVQKYAANAFKTAGLSANEYMETVTSFSASLLQSLGGDTEKAAKMADMAITDMSDNANKMGTSMESIQTAYQGFAKQNYTMLDNLKLGYGGTKSEMERLLSDAEAIKASQGEVASYSIESYADIVAAIHVVQDEMGITGTTSREAATTIEGSMNSAKAAWSNWLTAAADGNADLEAKTDELAESVVTAIENIAPVAIIAVENIGKAILELPDTIQKVEAAMRVDKLMEGTDDVTERFRAAAKSIDEINTNLQIAAESGEGTFYWSAELEKAQMVLEKLREESGGEIFALVTSGEMDAAEGANLLGISTEQLYRQMRGAAEEARKLAAEDENLSGATDAAVEGLDAEAEAAKEANQALAGIGLAAYEALTSSDDLRGSYDELKKELDGLDAELDEDTLAIVEHRLAVLDLAATNQELVDGLSAIPGAMDYASGSTAYLAQALIDAGLSADDYVSGVQSMRDDVVNSFKVMADESSISAADMGNALSSNLGTMQQWGSDLEALWAEAYANQDTAVMEYISYLSDLGPEYASAVHEFASGGYDELSSQAESFADIGELSAKYTAEGMAAKAYLAGDATTELSDEAIAAIENADFETPGAEIPTEITAGIDSAAYTVANAATSAVDGAYTDAKNKASDFYYVGRSMDSGMVSGLYDGSDAVTAAAKAVAKKALDAAKSVLKINSPSKVFRDQIGRSIPEGMALGIRQSAKLVEDAMRGLADDTLGALNPMDFSTDAYNIEPVYAGTGNGAPINNYITVNGAENPEDWANRFVRKLDQQMRMA